MEDVLGMLDSQPWPMFRGNPARTGEAVDPVALPLELKWSFDTGHEARLDAGFAERLHGVRVLAPGIEVAHHADLGIGRPDREMTTALAVLFDQMRAEFLVGAVVRAHGE